MNEPVTDQESWDVFVSYTEVDRGWAEWISWHLEESGLRVLVQTWDFGPGSNWVNGMHVGIEKAERIIAVLSPAYLSSVFGTAEWQAIWLKDADAKARSVLPVRVADCQRPGLLGPLVSVDLFGVDEPTALVRLLKVVAPEGDRAKPLVKPSFPGGSGTRRRSGPAGREPPRFPTDPPAIWNVPARNPNFTGRVKDLARLQEALSGRPTPTVCSLHGMGGVGKTQTAIEYLHTRAGDFDLVWWINAEDPVAIGGQFAELAKELEIPGVEDLGLGAVVRLVHRELRGRSRWLLAFDNAEEIFQTGPVQDAVSPLPPAGSGQVLITTRRDGFRDLGQVLDINVPERADAAAILQRRAPSLSARDALAVSRRLGDLPLALAQAGAFLDKSQLPAAEYLSLLQTRSPELHRRGTAAGNSKTVATVWLVSVDRLRTQLPAAVQLLALCAWMAAEPVPLDLFIGHPEPLPSPLREAVTDRVAFVDAVAALVDYSLVRRTGNDILMHRLTQDFVRNHRAADADRSQSLGQVLALLRADLSAQAEGSPANSPRWRQLLRHVMVATRHPDIRPSSGTADAAWLLDRAGHHLKLHGRPGDAVPLLRQSVQLSRTVDDWSGPETATTLDNLGLGLADLGQSFDAIRTLEEALQILEAAEERDDFTIATVLNHRGYARVRLGRPADAVPDYLRAIGIRERAGYPDDERLVADLNGLGRALADAGRPEEALSFLQRSLQVCQSAFFHGSPRVIGTTLIYLGRALTDLDRSREALPLYEKALSLWVNAYGGDHPWVATVMNRQGHALMNLARYDEARQLYEQAGEILEGVYGIENSDVVIDLDDIGPDRAGLSRSSQEPHPKPKGVTTDD